MCLHEMRANCSLYPLYASKSFVRVKKSVASQGQPHTHMMMLACSMLGHQWVVEIEGWKRAKKEEQPVPGFASMRIRIVYFAPSSASHFHCPAYLIVCPAANHLALLVHEIVCTRVMPVYACVCVISSLFMSASCHFCSSHSYVCCCLVITV